MVRFGRKDDVGSAVQRALAEGDYSIVQGVFSQTRRPPESDGLDLQRYAPDAASSPDPASTHKIEDGRLRDSSVFICYRRSDDPAFAGRIYDRLVDKFGDQNVFIDIESIEAGANWLQVLKNFIRRCSVAVVVIGPRWLPEGKSERRIDSDSDTVRIELELALAEGVAILPILVNDARMPNAQDLPKSIRKLAEYNALDISHKRFRSDVSELVSAIERVLRR